MSFCLEAIDKKVFWKVIENMGCIIYAHTFAILCSDSRNLISNRMFQWPLYSVQCFNIKIPEMFKYDSFSEKPKQRWQMKCAKHTCT